MIHYLAAFAWGLVLLASLVGWGGALSRFVLRRSPDGPGLSAALGAAFAIAVGGVLNLFGAISPGSLVGFVGIGSLFPSLGRRTETGEEPKGRPATEAAVVIALILLVRYVGAVQPGTLNRHDDLTGYVVYPERMLQTGTMGDDPFNVRRMESALGGMSFLHAAALAVVRVENLAVVDLGVGLIVAALCARDLARRAGLTGWWAAAPVVIVAFDRSPSVNITASLTGAALLLALYGELEREGPAWSRAVAASLIAAGLCAVKSSFIPIAGLLPALHYGRRLLQGRGGGEAAAALVLTIVWLAPWMESTRRSSGTPLYPILGKGVHGSGYGTFDVPGDVLRGAALLRNEYLGLTNPLAAAVWVAAAWSLIPALRARRAGTALPVCLQVATWLSALFLHRMFETVDAFRYMAPVYTASLVVSLVEIGRNAPTDRTRRAVEAALVVAWTLGSGWEPARVRLQTSLRNARAAVADGRPAYEDRRAAVRRMQEAVPPGEPLVVWIATPHLLDFQRNPIHVIDWPGAASPAPGLPYRAGSEAVARYLVERGLPRFAFEPRIREGYSTEEILARAPIWVRSVGLHALDLFRSLEELVETRCRLHDADGFVVLDLSRRR